MNTHVALAAPIGATPCASADSVARAIDAMNPFLQWRTTEAPPVQGMVLLDCQVKRTQRLQCTASSHTDSPYDLSAAAVAFASELEVCPGTPRHLVFPLTFRGADDEAARQPPSP